MTATVIRADAHDIPLADGSVDLIVTSPPYWSLRSYTDGGEHYDGQIGAEPTHGEYIASLIACTREWMRVLKSGGSMFVNLGDKYNAYNGGRGQGTIQRNEIRQAAPRGNGLDADGIRNKSLMLLPERYRIAAVDELGLIARAVIVWSKPNGLPESVTDRVRRSHEDWVHLTKQPRYFSAIDEIRERHVRNDGPRPLGTRNATQRHAAATDNTGWKDHEVAHNPLGKLPGSVWEIATEPLKVPVDLGVDHFAAFPTEWPRRIILGWSPSGICIECGDGRRPLVEATHERPDGWPPGMGGSTRLARRAPGSARPSFSGSITGELCACPDASAPTRPAVVLDPFSGTGTTALVASVLGRHGISVDMSADYCRLARWRTTDPGQRAKAARVAAPPKQINGQGDLFAGLGVAV